MNKKFLSAILFGALAVTSTGSFVSCKDYDDDIDNLQTQINGLASAKDLSEKISTLQSAITSAQSAAEAKAAAAQIVADAAKAAADKASSNADAASALVDALKATVADLEAKGATKEELDAAKAVITDAAASVLKAVEEAKAESKSADEVLAAAVEAAQEKADAAAKAAAEAADEAKTLATKVSDLEAKLEKAVGEEDVKALAALAKELEGNVQTLSEKLGVISKRLTSVVFLPSTYINGIEAIKFVNLQYTNWSTDPAKWLADGPAKIDDKWDNKQVEDYGAKVEYMVSPAGVNKDGIKDYAFLLNDATNTRATAKAADLELSFIETPEIDAKGKLTGYVKKTFKNKKDQLPGTSSHYQYTVELNDGSYHYEHAISSTSENLIVASLKATIADNLKTAEEKDQEVAVYSDWTRVNEEWGTPYIHNKIQNANYPHFVNYSSFYNDYYRSNKFEGNLEKHGPEAIFTEGHIYVAKKQLYTEKLNLLDLVTVCINRGNTLIADYGRYGLEFEFNLLDYKIANHSQQNANLSQDYTNQKDFASLEGTILSSKAPNGLTDNKVAVGRTPVIQAVLKDTKNDAVIDVRYFMVEWVDKMIEVNEWDTPFEKVAPWQCTRTNGYENYVTYILEPEMDDFFSKIVDGGIDKKVFRSQYPTTSQIFLGEISDEVKAAVLDNDFTNLVVIGQAQWADDWYETYETQNIKLTYNFINPRKADSAEPKDKETPADAALAEDNFSKTGFFYFESSDNTNRIFIPVKINVKAGHYEYVVKKDPLMWDKNSQNTRDVNPAQRDALGDYNFAKGYKTTQMVGSLTAGYYYNSEKGNSLMPSSIHNLLDHFTYENKQDKATVSDIVFDADKVKELPVRTIKVDGKDQNCTWFVENNGKTLFNAYKKDNVYYGKLVAARIVDNDIYLTDDADNTTTGKEYVKGSEYPNAASLLLVDELIPVIVTATNCETTPFDNYVVKFSHPLKFNGLDNPIELVDIKDGGSSAAISISSIKVQEDFGANDRIISIVKPVEPQVADFETTKAYEDAKAVYDKEVKAYDDAKDLRNWYGVQTLVVDLENAMTNWEVEDGKFTKKLSSILMNNDETDPMPKYVLRLVDKYGKLTTDPEQMAGIRFDNLSNNSIGKDKVLEIEVPVFVDTKWQKVSNLKGILKVTVKSKVK